MRVLVACESSGRVRDAFIKKGCNAISCDRKDTEVNGPHYKGDVRDIINDGFDLMIAFPPCTYLCVAGAVWFKNKGRKEKQEEALNFIKFLMDTNINRICIENPVGIISTKIRQPDQIINPFLFGEPFQKRTCLWLKNLPFLTNIKVVGKGEFYIGKTGIKYPKWMNRNGKNTDRTVIRSRTFQGIANAMAYQWSGLTNEKFENNRNKIFTYKSILCERFKIYD